MKNIELSLVLAGILQFVARTKEEVDTRAGTCFGYKWNHYNISKCDLFILGHSEEFRPVIGRFSAHQRTNENGLRLIDFATSMNMAVRSTCFQHNLLDKVTWRSPFGTESQIDHVLIDGRHFSDIIDVKTYRGANIANTIW